MGFGSSTVRVLGSDLWDPELWDLVGVLGAGCPGGAVISFGVSAEFCGPGLGSECCSSAPFSFGKPNRSGFRAPFGCCCRPGSAPRAAGSRADLCGRGRGTALPYGPINRPINRPINGPVPHNSARPPGPPSPSPPPPAVTHVLPWPRAVGGPGRGGGGSKQLAQQIRACDRKY